MTTTTVPITMRVPPAIAKAIRSQADKERRTINAMLTYAVEMYLTDAGAGMKAPRQRNKETTNANR